MAEPQPQLKRRRDRQVRHECWRIWFDDVRIGKISQRSGAPKSQPQWQWQPRFLSRQPPRRAPRRRVAASYEAARAAFLEALGCKPLVKQIAPGAPASSAAFIEGTATA